ncbi:nucleoside/nucleotide kinase family protein [Oceanitalea stevensii]|uniref:nucleoside/nucleotide kinase family protein n=1 Tax=Oceanitalea stevensii TaxID=2763072 RepID=UPI002044D390|nr:nucleoside/nucleotide kinase family protein [Oceanitalea stevensii]
MAPPTLHATLPELVERAPALLDDGAPRRLLGLAGPPGAGKSTLAAGLVAALAPRAALVPMDGFHLSNAVLHALGRRGRKGAPDTFDAAGYAHLLRRLRAPAEGTVYAPDFDRELDEPVAAAVAVPPQTGLVVTEGNYLLLDDGAWPDARSCLDAVWYVDLPDEERRRRLRARHERHGMDPAAAAAWTEGTDEPNAALVRAVRDRADVVVVLAG